MSCIVFSTTTFKNSKVDSLAVEINSDLKSKNIDSSYLNVGELNLPICDGYTCYEDPNVISLQKRTQKADGFIFCSPVYNYDVNAICKNLIELCGQSFIDKPVGIAVVAGGEKSYMSPIGFINSLMLDFRCLIIPRFIYATGADYSENNVLSSDDIKKRISQLTAYYKKLVHVK